MRILTVLNCFDECVPSDIALVDGGAKESSLVWCYLFLVRFALENLRPFSQEEPQRLRNSNFFIFQSKNTSEVQKSEELGKSDFGDSSGLGVVPGIEDGLW